MTAATNITPKKFDTKLVRV